jgi:hypothetical protein
VTLRHFTLGLLLLALSTALPVHGWAMGTMARVADVVVICSGAGTHTALIDWRGEKVDPVPNCPDCAPAAGIGLIAHPATLPAPLEHGATLSGFTHAGLSPEQVYSSAWPRAPPSERFSRKL